MEWLIHNESELDISPVQSDQLIVRFEARVEKVHHIIVHFGRQNPTNKTVKAIVLISIRKKRLLNEKPEVVDVFRHKDEGIASSN